MLREQLKERYLMSSPTYRHQHEESRDQANGQSDDQLDHDDGLDKNALVGEEHLAVSHGYCAKRLHVNVSSCNPLHSQEEKSNRFAALAVNLFVCPSGSRQGIYPAG